MLKPDGHRIPSEPVPDNDPPPDTDPEPDKQPDPNPRPVAGINI